MLPIFKQLEEMFMGIKADDEADDEVDDETDDETDLPELETEESPEKKKETWARSKNINSKTINY